MGTELTTTVFLDALKAGVQRTTDLIAHATEYHGGALRTEYMLTSDIAREFIERDFEVKIECLNRSLVNGFTALRAATPVQTLRSQRTDVAVVENGIVPLAMIEVKIGVTKLSRVRGDLNKIASTMSMLKAKFAANMIGAAVFQVHIPGTKSRYYPDQFKAAAEKVEKSLSSELKAYASSRRDFDFTMHSLQSPGSGISGRALEVVGDELAWGKHGHATRHHAILIRSTRQVPPPPTNILELREQSEE